MKKVLFISYFFPPIHCVESTMALNVIKYLPENNWQIDVISALYSKEWGSDRNYQDSLLPSHIKVHRTNIFENIFVRVLNKLKLIPDSAFGWVYFALSKANKLLQIQNYDIIISRNNPISSHLVVLNIKKRLPSLPWVAVFGDSWVDNPYIKHLPKWIINIRHKIERNIIKNADKIVVTTNSTKDLFVKRHGFKDKFVVLPNTYDPEEIAKHKNATYSSQDFTIAHIGNLYGNRSPMSLFTALGRLKDVPLRVKLIGSLGEYKASLKDCNIAHIVKCTGMVSKNRALFEAARSDMLLLIEAPTEEYSIFLPTKLLEYIALEKPILAIASKGEATDIINQYNLGSVVEPSNVEDISQAIRKYAQLFSIGQLKQAPSKEVLKKFSAKTYGQTLSFLLDETIS